MTTRDISRLPKWGQHEIAVRDKKIMELTAALEVAQNSVMTNAWSESSRPGLQAKRQYLDPTGTFYFKTTSGIFQVYVNHNNLQVINDSGQLYVRGISANAVYLFGTSS